MSQNERLARSIIRSNTNSTQRHSLLWLANIEKAIVGALDAKDAAREEAKGNLVFRDKDGKPTAVLDTSKL
jgi:hypothetical protein